MFFSTDTHIGVVYMSTLAVSAADAITEGIFFVEKPQGSKDRGRDSNVKQNTQQ